MITETAKVVDISPEHLWVQTIRQSACNGCRAQAGCGQAVLNRLGQETGLLKVCLGQNHPQQFELGQMVTIGIGEGALVRSVMLMYLLPLIFMGTGIILADRLTVAEGGMAIAALTALGLGALAVRWVLARARNTQQYEPVLIADTSLQASPSH